MLKFVLLVNKQGQTRLSQYYEYVAVEERVTTEADIVRKCLARSEDSVSKTGRRTLQYDGGTYTPKSPEGPFTLKSIVRRSIYSWCDLL